MAVVASRRRTVVISVVVAAVLLIAAVTVFLLVRGGGGSSGTTAAPTSSAPEVPDPPVNAPVARITPIVGSDAVPSEAGVAAQLAGPLANPALEQFTGIVTDAATGQTLWNRDAATPQIPASTAKLLTGAALLTSVDPESRFTTRVVQGDQAGDIVLVGGGDVTLSARAEGSATVTPGAASMADLAEQVKATGVPVQRIVLDTSYWSGPELADGWLTADIKGTAASPQGFLTPMSALMVDGDRVDPAVQNSPRTGEPATTAGQALARFLGTPDLTLVPGTAPEGTAVLGEVQSQPMDVLLAQALENSDNILAEALARQVAIARGAPPSFAGATAAIVEAIGALNIDTIGVEMSDGSGLSSQDRVPPAVMAQVVTLAVNGQVPELRNLLNGLPVGGVSGSLIDRYKQPESVAGAGWVRAKTGSLGVTYALAGFVPDVDGRMLVFSFNSNGVIGDPTRWAQDAVAAALRGCGCR